MKKIKIIIFALIFSTIILFTNTKSKAANGFDAFNNAPRFTFSTSTNKFDDVTILISDNTGLNLSYLKIYDASDLNNPKSIDSKYISKSVVTKSGNLITEYKYVISKDYFKNFSKKYYIQASDIYQNINKIFWAVEKKSDHFVVNSSPRVSNWNSLSETSVSFNLTDGNGVDYVIVEDRNNSNKSIVNKGNLKAGTSTITIDLNKFNANNNVYNLKIITKDASSYGLTSNSYICFSVHKIKYIAHRGAATLAPENTLKAFNLVPNSAFGIETDVQSTKDNVLVCLHDSTVTRTTNGTGHVSKLTYSKISSLLIDVGSKLSSLKKLERKIPKFDAYLNVCKSKKMYAIVELKTPTKTSKVPTKTINKTLEELKKKNMLNNCIIISFDKSALQTIRNKNSNVKLGYLVNTTGNSMKNDINTAAKIKNCTICPHTITQDLVNYAHSKKVSVNVWTYDSATNKEKFRKLGVDYITTNRF